LDLIPIIEAKNKHQWDVVFGDATKNPGICGQWKNQINQTEEQLKQLYEQVKQHAHNWGPITGKGLIAYDFDWPWVFGLWLNHFKNRADTLIIETPNGGARVFYYTNEESLGDPFKDSLHLEIKTNHYVAAGGEALTQDNELKPYIIIQNDRIKVDNEILHDTINYLETLLETKYSWLNYHCISEYLTKCKKRIILPHETGLAIANFMLSNGCEDWEIHNFRKAVWDYKDNKYIQEYDEQKTQRQIDSTHKYLERKGKPPTCRTLLTSFNQTKDSCKGCPRKQETTSKTTFKNIAYIKDLTNTIMLKTIETSTNADTIWRYDEQKGIWIEDGIPYIEKNLRDLLGDKLKPRHLTEAIRITKVYTYTKTEDFIEDPGSIMLMNGEYSFSLATIQPPNPYHNHRNRLAIKYDPNADCPIFLKFLSDVCPGDEETIKELFGYFLIKGYPIQKAFIFQGTGANGKSTLLRVMEAFLGKENCSSVNLYDLVTKTFRIAELYNKLANISPDIGADELRRTGIFKALTGGDTITAERKLQHPFQFTNYAKLIFSCNILPTSPDTSDAFFRRFVILQFKRVFDESTADTNILSKITTDEELSGIFNWALNGYYQIQKNGRFTISQNVLDIREKYLAMSDPITAFIDYMIEVNPSAVTPKNEIWRYYGEFCVNNGYISMAENKFFSEFRKRVFVEDTKPTINGIQTRAFKGIELKIENRQVGRAGQVVYIRRGNLEKYIEER